MLHHIVHLRLCSEEFFLHSYKDMRFCIVFRLSAEQREKSGRVKAKEEGKKS